MIKKIQHTDTPQMREFNFCLEPRNGQENVIPI